MALRDLVDAECGGSNPMMRLASHLSQDKAQSRSTLHKNLSFTTRIDDNALVQEYLAETNPASAFRMDNLLQSINGAENVSSNLPNTFQNPKQIDSSWTKEFLRESKLPPQQDIWAGEPVAAEAEFRAPTLTQVQPPFSAEKWAEEYIQTEVPIIERDKSNLAGVAQDLLAATSTAETFKESEFFEFLRHIGTGDSTIIGGNNQTSSKQSSKSMHEGWVEEFNDLTDLDVENIEKADASKQDYWQSLENQWKDMATTEEHSWLSDFEEEVFENYEFREDNPLLGHQNPLEEGKKKLSEGDVPSAALLFEVAALVHPESHESWFLLGTTQAKNEQDPKAIAALKKAAALDPSHLPTIMALAVSYTNESYQALACETLKDWISKNPLYSDLTGSLPMESQTKSSTSSFMTPEMHSITIDLFLKAARLQVDGKGVDPDVQCGLGILFNLSGEYEKAVDCFRAALSVRPDDSLLWNKLGATLANGNKSEEAVSAYHTALQISPGFIRCRYNLGICCVNLKAYAEASQHFLTALNFQAAGRGLQGQEVPRSCMSIPVWSSLRLSLSMMDRKDLLPKLDERDLKFLSQELKVNI